MARLLVAALPLTAVACPPSVIPHSNTTAAPCTGGLNTTCAFSCDAGFLAVGVHACQSYTTASGVVAIDSAFFGGRCDPLCGARDAPPCAPGTVPVRRNVTDGDSWCLNTTCLTADAALRRVARGAYGVWRLGRDDATGIYTGDVDATAPASAQSSIAHIGINGVALMFECVAAEMGWISRADAVARVTLSLRALAGLDLAAVRLAEPWEWRAEPVALVRALRTLTWPSPALPIDVDENGMAVRRDAGDGVIAREDGLTRPEFLRGYLSALLHARVAEDIPVRAYCHWTLVDNYELGRWAPRFEIYALEDPAHGEAGAWSTRDAAGHDAAGAYARVASAVRDHTGSARSAALARALLTSDSQ